VKRTRLTQEESTDEDERDEGGKVSDKKLDADTFVNDDAGGDDKGLPVRQRCVSVADLIGSMRTCMYLHRVCMFREHRGAHDCGRGRERSLALEEQEQQEQEEEQNAEEEAEEEAEEKECVHRGSRGSGTSKANFLKSPFHLFLKSLFYSDVIWHIFGHNLGTDCWGFLAVRGWCTCSELQELGKSKSR